jgi:4'-phosphopantetheinyl transferase
VTPLIDTAISPDPAPLGEGRVDLWLTALSGIGDDLQAAYQRLLCPSEQARWRRFRVEGARLQYLVGRALVRTSLSHYAAVSEAAWRFDTNDYGCPYISEPATCRNIRFNLSHTDELVACAVRSGGDVGVDVENTGRVVDIGELAPSVFAPVEVTSLARSAPQDQRRDFFSYWTLKEAYIKARGMGISLALDGFWFDLTGPSPRIHFTDRCPDDPQRWRFYQYRPTNEHMLAVAVSARPRDTIDVCLRWVVPLSASPAC